METPIMDDEQDQSQEPIQVQQNGSAEFGAMPDVQQQQHQINQNIAQGAAQGQSAPYTIGTKAKEFFNLQSDDFLSIILVFVLLLIVSTGSLNSVMTMGGSMFISSGPCEKLTMVGAVVISIVFSLLYFIVKVLGRNFL